ncbi:MAG: hypothetical protein ABSA94_18555 [Acidobacteriaceae bacterium]
MISDQSPEAQKPEIKVQKNGGPTRFEQNRKAASWAAFSFFHLSSEYQIQRLKRPKYLAWKAFCISVCYFGEAVEA